MQNAVSLGGWQETAKVRGKCVFVGGLYPAKRLRFLLEAAEMVAASRPDFRLHIIGDGPDRDLITMKQPPYVVYHGVLIGEEREQHLRQAELTLMPGLVGLVVLDAFAGRAPLVTVASQRHSPEIEYLVPGHNGVVLDEGASARTYADAVLSLLADDLQLTRLREGCVSAAATYRLEDMVDRFAAGVLKALARSSKTSRSAS